MLTIKRPAVLCSGTKHDSPCSNILGMIEGDEFVSRHRGRELRVPLRLPVTLACENCKTLNVVSADARLPVA